MPLDTAGLERLARTEDGLFKAIFSRMSEPERVAFGDEQIESLKNACGRLHWDKHPVDIRLSVPVLIARYYLVLLAGPERRNAIRRKDERARHHFDVTVEMRHLKRAPLGSIAVEVIAQDEVHDTRDGIRTIDRRRAPGNDLDPVAVAAAGGDPVLDHRLLRADLEQVAVAVPPSSYPNPR